jgi:hypothetical protein
MVGKKKTRVTSSSPGTSRDPRSPFAHNAAASIPEAKGAGHFDRIPKEIRQSIYAYCLEIDEPILLKQCCGPTSTRRERASCKKHGDHCSKIGKENGLMLYKEDERSTKVHGRFTILSISRSVNEEASWVLHTHGRLSVRSTPALQAYLSDKHCTFFRLPNLPTDEYVERMWLSVARFRKVCLELPWTESSVDDPVECVYRLYDATAFLIKAWDLVKENSESPRTIELHLHALYTAILPFNANRSSKIAYEWTAYHQSHLEHGYIADFEVIGNEVAHTLERFLDLVRRHGGRSCWKVVAQAPRGYNARGPNKETDTVEDQEDRGLTGLHSLEVSCLLGGVAFMASTPSNV